MAFWTVLTPPQARMAGLSPPDARSRAALEEAVLLKDGFSLPAFIFTGFWLLAKRLWLALAVFVALWAAIGLGGRWLGLDPLALAVAQGLIGLFLGLEGHALIERKLVRQGYSVAGVVEARDEDAAERRFFELAEANAATGPAPSAAVAAGPAAPRAPAPPVVLGLFPDATR
jgi:hypothetical protein